MERKKYIRPIINSINLDMPIVQLSLSKEGASYSPSEGNDDDENPNGSNGTQGQALAPFNNVNRIAPDTPFNNTIF